MLKKHRYDAKPRGAHQRSKSPSALVYWHFHTIFGRDLMTQKPHWSTTTPLILKIFKEKLKKPSKMKKKYIYKSVKLINFGYILLKSR